MTSKKAVDTFLTQEKIAVVGVSRDTRKFGFRVFEDLREKGYQVFAINPQTDSIDGQPCYPDLSALPEKVDGIVTVLPPENVPAILGEAVELGIKNIWMQQGSNSSEAEKFCEENGLSYVAGECIFMFTEPVESIHRFHRWINKVLGLLPK